MSPRAAWRLEELGFTDVYDYVPGKQDWFAADLPYEGEAIFAGRAVRRDVPTCRPDELLGDVAARVPDEVGLCPVLDHEGVVMGVATDDALSGDTEQQVAAVMRFGTTTVRPSEDLPDLVQRMQEASVDAILVTRPDATFVGVLLREEAEALLHQVHEHEHDHPV